jgi:hypothetical protein
MFAISPDQSLLWLAIRQGWGIGQFVPNAAGGSAQGTSVRRSVPRKSVTSPLSHRRATDALPSIG